jgi:hypothetical protein
MPLTTSRLVAKRGRGCDVLSGVNWIPNREGPFDLLRNRAVVDLSVVGRLPEVVVALAEDRYVSSFMTAAGDPSWALFDRRGDLLRALSVRGGTLNIDIKLRSE